MAAFAHRVRAAGRAGIACSPLDDVAGLVVMRTVAMLANEAADAVVQGVCSADAIDVAMQQGRQLSARAARVGGCDRRCACSRRTLANLRAHYGEDRYRISPLIARRACDRSRLRMGEHHPIAPARRARARRARSAGDVRATTRVAGLGMRIAAVGPGHAELTMTVRADMLNGHAICHGGFIFTLADSAFAFACNSYNCKHGRVRLRRSISSRRRTRATC